MIRRFAFAALLMIAALPACSNSDSREGSARVPETSVQEKAWAAVRAGAPLVDVRTQDEFDAGHLDGAILIPYDEIDSRANEIGAGKDQTIVLYCRTGNRSGKAKATLEAMGYAHVINGGGYESMRRAAARAPAGAGTGGSGS